MNKMVLYAGGALAAVAVFTVVAKRSAASAAAQAAQDNSGGASYYPPTVYGAGASGVSTTAQGTSTGDAVSSLLSAQLATTQINANTTMYQTDAQKAIALDNNKTSEDLANISLASQTRVALTNIATALFGGSTGSGGALGQTQQAQAAGGGFFGALFGNAGSNFYSGGNVSGSLGFDKSNQLQINVTKQAGSVSATATDQKQNTDAIANIKSIATPNAQNSYSNGVAALTA